MDTKMGPQSPGTPGEDAPLFRHMLLTNIQWMWQLSRDVGTAAYAPTFSWDWKKQPMRVPIYGPEFTRKYAEAVAEFVKAPMVHRCPYCAEIEGNPKGSVVEMEPPPPIPPPAPGEYDDILAAEAATLRRWRKHVGEGAVR